MPKLHDACQIFAEEILGRLGEFDQAARPFVLALVYHAVEEDLANRHPQATEIINHLWIVLEESIVRLYPDLDRARAMRDSPIPEGDIRLQYLIHSALQSSRSFFPSRR